MGESYSLEAVSRRPAGPEPVRASKAALMALARSWAAEVVSTGVTVNVVSPAATQTRMLEDPGRARGTPKVPPLGRLIQPDEIAALVCYCFRITQRPSRGRT
jgi:NAD(P)-dependent dehydrogenase (short-subunit alcohol dehydrogenase family)